MDRQGFKDWLDRYVDAWKTYDAGKIGALFSDDVQYRYHPQDEPVLGRDAVVRDWLENPDEKGTYDASYEVCAIDGDVHVATGWSRYLDGPGGEPRDEYNNVYVCRFNDAGECSEFTEYWIQNRRFRRESLARMISEHGGTPPA
jgi:ketosteroid isomerase-like protein